MKRIIVLFLWLTFQSGLLYSQVDDELYKASLQIENVEILMDSMHISFTGQKAFYIYIIIERSVEYRILSEKGLQEISSYTLPQPIDEIYKPHAPTIVNAQRIYDEISVIGFDAIAKQPNGESVALEISRESIPERIVVDQTVFGDVYKYLYTIEGLNVGDIVKLNYSYKFPLRANLYSILSSRIFMHSKYPRKMFDFKFTFHKDLEFDTAFINISPPVYDTVENYVTLSWQHHNLPGCLDDPGSRPHAELPWFSFSPLPYELLYEDFDSFKESFIPLWYVLGLNRESMLGSAAWDNILGVKDKDNLAFEKLARRYQNMAPDDSVGITKLRYFQRFVADSVNYDNNFAYFDNEQSYKKDHPGQELMGHKVYERTKEFIYASMIPRLSQTFFTAYISDSRYGYIGPDFLAPIFDNEMLVGALLFNNTMAFLCPKYDKRNLYCEEMPFYYENVPVLLLNTFDYAGYKRNFLNEIRLLRTPASSIKDNYRKINSIAKVDLDKNQISFSTKISLSGQYSTLTRGVYNDSPVDSTINPTYLKKVWEIRSHVEITTIDVGETEFYYPYKTHLDVSFKVTDLINKKENGFEIPLAELLKHVYADLSKGPRFTDFYPDFQGSDSYAYMLDFQQPVSIGEDIPAFSFENEFGIYTFSVKQLDDQKILINSYYMVKIPYVVKENIDWVHEVFDGIKLALEAKINIQLNGSQ